MNNIKAIIDTSRETVNTIKGVGSDGWDSLKTIATFLNFIIHPSLIIKALWAFTEIYSFWICLFVALASMILCGFGFKKFAKFVPLSMVLYSLIKCIGSVF